MAEITVVPANEASWEDLQLIFSTRGDPRNCRCQYFKVPGRQWLSLPLEERTARQQNQANCGDPDAETTTGLVAYLDDAPAGWCAVEPRTAYPRLMGHRVPWLGRAEDKTDAGVWAVTCFVTRTGFRRQGVSRALAAATVEYARSRGARAVEAYSMITQPGKEVTWGELFVGSRSIFADAGYREVSRPFLRRAVMRFDF